LNFSALKYLLTVMVSNQPEVFSNPKLGSMEAGTGLE